MKLRELAHARTGDKGNTSNISVIAYDPGDFAFLAEHVTADRVRLGCYGLNGGKAGQPFCVTVDLEGEARDLGGLVDGEPVLAGQVVRVVTTGGGGWGDPLEREPELVQRDVIEGRVSRECARDDYGVVFSGDADTIDAAATVARRNELRAKRAGAPPMIDRGEGFDKMLRGEHKPRMRE